VPPLAGTQAASSVCGLGLGHGRMDTGMDMMATAGTAARPGLDSDRRLGFVFVVVQIRRLDHRVMTMTNRECQQLDWELRRKRLVVEWDPQLPQLEKMRTNRHSRAVPSTVIGGTFSSDTWPGTLGPCSLPFPPSVPRPSLTHSSSYRKHTGERPFTCHCGKQFSRLDNLRQHAQTVHTD
jgi:hypothetical protein